MVIFQFLGKQLLPHWLLPHLRYIPKKVGEKIKQDKKEEKQKGQTDVFACKILNKTEILRLSICSFSEYEEVSIMIQNFREICDSSL